tara:strand:- start:688 stop:897 length:210 start_codon:yes stop_codon:yes gene_type:complete
MNIVDTIKINKADSKTRNSSILLSIDIDDLWLRSIRKDEAINIIAVIRNKLKRQLVSTPRVILLNIYII